MALKDFSLQPADFAVLAIILIITILMGILPSILGRKMTNSKDYITGGNTIHWIPLSLSLLAAFQSATFMLGMPAEIYFYGSQMWISAIGLTSAIVFCSIVILPFYYKRRVSSLYEYLEARYESLVLRKLVSFVYIVQMTLQIGVGLYSPCLALSTVTSMEVATIAAIAGSVCTIYACIGGLKGIIYSDVFQCCVILGGYFTLIGLGIKELPDGISTLWSLSKQGGRLDTFNFNFSIFERHNFWNLLVGNFFVTIYNCSCSQVWVQRFNSTPSVRYSQRAFILGAFGVCFLVTITVLTGLTIYSVYFVCDPLEAGFIELQDQILPYFIYDVLGKYEGVTGLLLASLLCSSLSTIAGIIHSLATLVWVDFLRHICSSRIRTDRGSVIAIKLLAMMFGIAAILLTFIINKVSSIIELSLKINSVISGPIISVFLLGLFLPFINAKGIYIGMLCGYGVTLPIMMVNLLSGTRESPLETNISGCPESNRTITLLLREVEENNRETSGLESYLTISYTLYTVLGSVMTTVMSVIFSFLTGGCLERPAEHTFVHFCGTDVVDMPQEVEMIAGQSFKTKKLEGVNSSELPF